MDSKTKILLFKKRAVRGLLALSVRRIVIQILQSVANIILARTLFPADFGIFAIIFFYVSIFELVADIGLAASLLQRGKEPTDRELKSIFTAHFSLGCLSFVLMLLGSGVFLSFYQELSGYSKLLFMSSLAPLFYNLKLVPHALLERKLEYKRLVVGEIVEVAILEVVTVFLALSGFGVASFVWGLVISRLAGVIIFYLLEPWRVGFNLSLSSLRPYLAFGFDYQVNHVIGVASGAVAPVLVGTLVGTSALGLINWAGGIAALPRVIGEIVGRLTFPFAARIQKNKELLQSTFGKAIEVTSLTSFPLAALMLALARPITYIVFTGKWEQGISSLYLFTIQSEFIVFSLIFTNFLLALGEARLVRNVNLFWVILSWIFTIPLIRIFGFVGYPLATLITSSIFFIYLIELKKRINFNLSSTLPYLSYSLLAGLIVYLYSLLFPIRSLVELALSGFFGLTIYALLVLFFRKNRLIQLCRSFARYKTPLTGIL